MNRKTRTLLRNVLVEPTHSLVFLLLDVFVFFRCYWRLLIVCLLAHTMVTVDVVVLVNNQSAFVVDSPSPEHHHETFHVVLQLEVPVRLY